MVGRGRNLGGCRAGGHAAGAVALRARDLAGALGIEQLGDDHVQLPAARLARGTQDQRSDFVRAYVYGQVVQFGVAGIGTGRSVPHKISMMANSDMATSNKSAARRACGRRRRPGDAEQETLERVKGIEPSS